MTIIQGDCLEVMRSMEDNCIDFIVTDPPYGLSFMNKNWDKVLPNINIWKETLRICKPGAFMACFGGTRTFHRLTCLIEDSGWEIRDCIMWLYGSGFPKGKGCLKPAWEPIILARKRGPNPRLNIDECRIQILQNDDIHKKNPHTKNKGENEIYGDFKGGNYEIPTGRWPANLILDEESAEMLDQQIGILKSGDLTGQPRVENKLYGRAGLTIGNPRFYKGDIGGASRFFYCAKASSRERNEGLEDMPLKDFETYYGCTTPGNNFPKHGGPRHNIHPTVKPLALMRYLIKLLASPNDPVLLDPFCGSGSTLIAAEQLGIRSIGIEMNSEYCEIANKRLGKNLNSSQIFSLEAP